MTKHLDLFEHLISFLFNDADARNSSSKTPLVVYVFASRATAWAAGLDPPQASSVNTKAQIYHCKKCLMCLF